jgi:DNA-binding protein HU-beta
LLQDHDLPKKQAGGGIGRSGNATTRHLAQGNKIRLTPPVIDPNASGPHGRNPATGEAIQIKASKKIAFRPSKELKEAVRGPNPQKAQIAFQPSA